MLAFRFLDLHFAHFLLLPRMRIALTDYSSLEEVLRAVRDLPYEGGSRRTGDALRFLVDHVFGPVIRRDHAPKVQSVERCEKNTLTLTHTHAQKLWRSTNRSHVF